MRFGSTLAVVVPLLACLALAGCGSGSDGQPGQPGAPGASSGLLAGQITNSMTGLPMAGVEVELLPAVVPNPTTDAGGNYSIQLPVGAYQVICDVDNYVPHEHGLSILAAQTTDGDMELEPVEPVLVTISGVPSHPKPGDAFSPTAMPEVLDGSSILSYSWTQTHSAAANIQDPNTATPTITLGDVAAYKDVLIDRLVELDRTRIMPINPHDWEHALIVAFECEVVTTSGAYHEEVEVHTDIREFAAWSSGLGVVPIDTPVLLGGREQLGWNWSLTSAPAGSGATLADAASRYPYFTPDEAGDYDITETTSGDTLTVIAGTWQGIVTGKGLDGLPEMDNCTGCHNDTIAPEYAQFDLWRQSGHAHIFEVNLNTSGHYSDGCFACHTVGFDPDGDNEGMDDKTDYDVWYAEFFPDGHSHPAPDNYVRSLAAWPDNTAPGNIQCENCHGPQNGGHMRGIDVRMSLASDVCGVCHGEPPRHGRFQQWQESGHGNYELAIDEGESGSCSRCHTANGFMAWRSADYGGSSVTVTWGPDEVHPVTCAVCHETHDVGTVSGHDNNAEIRISGDTPELLAGFTATNVGTGAMCMMCHNSRRGLANDYEGLPNASRPDYAPHGGCQTDVVMGQNAFYVLPGIRGAHSYLSDSCVTCHLELTPPPAELSYNLGGTNHSFAASYDICSDCHGAFDADNMVAEYEDRMEQLEEAIEDAIAAEIAFHLAVGNTILVEGYDSPLNEDNEISTTIDGLSTWIIEGLAESHGRSAMDIRVDGTTYYHVRLNADTTIYDATPTDLGGLCENTQIGNNGLDLSKINWNYWLLHSDGSHGIHNPSWAEEIMVATVIRISDVWGGP